MSNFATSETLLMDLEEVAESKSLMSLLEAPNIVDLVASSKEPHKLKQFLQRVKEILPGMACLQFYKR